MIHIIIGTRAQFIKMVPVMALLRDEGTPYSLIHTGQHRATIDDILDEFSLRRPDVLLSEGRDVVSPPGMFSWSLGILSRGIAGRRTIFRGDRGGVVLVHGDTASTILGALLGRAAGMHVAHVESGLRSFNLRHPFPEELTRVLAIRLSHTLFCPGPWALGNVAGLKKTAIDTGVNTMADTVALARRADLRRDHLPDGPFALASLHRYENIFHRDRLRDLVGHLGRIAEKCRLLFILHPSTEARLRRCGLLEVLSRQGNIELRPRYSYLDFFPLLRSAEFVVTDGGSIQEESSYLGIPCLLMRKASERPEGLGHNAVLSRYDPALIEDFAVNYRRYRKPPPDGDGGPSRIIVETIRKYR